MSSNKRANVWLGVAGLIIKDGKWLVVRKKYSGLKGMWSLPAGFVNPAETIDEAVIREVKEETGILSEITGLIGMRSGVINGEVSDNMIVFRLEQTGGRLLPQYDELDDAVFISPEELRRDPRTSEMLHFFLDRAHHNVLDIIDFNPGDHFGYTSYKLLV
ncbi:NUDIX hydrolase [Bacillus marinisedimentorum]|uniref:NUDIX hydrolase n=1 Tax=Bacillus marinisedimentorum TaxID=1821260 RepID=UPI0008733340|nr:NUDIX hydrolase [Bacillus marinisedimentorum]